MSKLLLITLAILISTCLSAQQLFQKAILSPRYEYGNSIDVFNGGHITAGVVSDTTFGFWPYLLKTDANGNHLWNKMFAHLEGGDGSRVIATSDGGFVMAGFYRNFLGQTDTTFILKCDANGNLLWSRLFYYGQGGSCIPTSLTETSDGGYIVSGSYENISPLNEEPYLLKTDANGNLLWARQYDDGNNSFVHIKHVTENSSGELYIAGKNHFFTEGQFLMKTGSTGSIQSMRVYRFPQQTFFYPVHISLRANNTIDIILNQSFSSNNKHLVHLNTDLSGIINSSHEYTIQGQTGMIMNVSKSSDDEILATGFLYDTISLYSDAIILKSDLAANTVAWSNAYGRSYFEQGNDVKPDQDGGIVMTGSAFADSMHQVVGGIPTDIFYMKVDANGSNICQRVAKNVTVTPFTITDSVYSLNESDITTTCFFADFSPQILNFYQDTSVCEVVGVEEWKLVRSMEVYPNPSNGSFTLSFESAGNSTAMIEMIDLMGRTFYSREYEINYGSNQIFIDNKSIPTGVYLLSLSTDGKRVLTRTVIHNQ